MLSIVVAVAERLCHLWGDGARFRIHTEPGAPREAPVLRLDAARAHKELDWQPRWRLDHALARTIEWYREFAAGADIRAFTLGQINSWSGSTASDSP